MDIAAGAYGYRRHADSGPGPKDCAAQEAPSLTGAQGEPTIQPTRLNGVDPFSEGLPNNATDRADAIVKLVFGRLLSFSTKCEENESARR